MEKCHYCSYHLFPLLKHSFNALLKEEPSANQRRKTCGSSVNRYAVLVQVASHSRFSLRHSSVLFTVWAQTLHYISLAFSSWQAGFWSFEGWPTCLDKLGTDGGGRDSHHLQVLRIIEVSRIIATTNRNILRHTEEHFQVVGSWKDLFLCVLPIPTLLWACLLFLTLVAFVLGLLDFQLWELKKSFSMWQSALYASVNLASRQVWAWRHWFTTWQLYQLSM